MVSTTMRGVGALLAVTGCGSQVNAEHCLFEGGDRGCGGTQSCMIVIGGGKVPEATNGCLDATEAAELDPERYVHLRYGLPATLEPEDPSDVLESDTMLGIFARQVVAHALEGVCHEAEGLASVEGLPQLELVLAARTRLDGLRAERRVRDDEAVVHAAEATAVEDLGASVDAWVIACEGRLEGSSGVESSETTGTTGATTHSETGSTTTFLECASNAECTDPATPLCSESGECVSCDEMPDPNDACATLDPLAPLCVGGACVQCTAAEPAACGRQVCDDATHTCVPCTEHAQCGEAACDLFTGECLLDAMVHVGSGLDFTTICEAITSFPEDARGTIVVHDTSYLESCTIDSGRRLALLADPGDQPTWDAAGTQLTVEPGAAVFIEGLRIAGNSSGVGLRMIGGQAWLDRVQLVENGTGAELQDGAEAVFRNSTVGVLTGGGYTAIYVQDASVELLYSTIIGDALSGHSLLCESVVTVSVRNSIVGNYNGNPIECDQAEVSYSVTTNAFPGAGNQNVGSMNTGWFVDSASGDFHLDPSYADIFTNVAQWQTGDPTLDLDGDPRPTVDGTPDFVGADLVP